MTAAAALLLLLEANAGAVLVVPPEPPSAPAGSEWVGEAVADLLPRALAELGVPAVDRADRLRAQEALEIPGVTLTRATAIRIAEALGASRLVVGRYEVQGPTLTLALRLLDVERGTLSAPLSAAGPPDKLSNLVRGLAWDIALAGPTRPGRTRDDFLAWRPSPPLEALQAYARGLAAPDAATRARQLKRALALVPGYDEARLALGRLQVDSREYADALDTLAKVKGDSTLGRQAAFLRGLTLLELGRYSQAAALYAMLASEEPTAAVLNNHALALLRAGSSADGVRASQVLKKVVDLRPEATDFVFNLGWALLVEGDAEAAAFWLRGVAQRDPRDAHARLLLGWALRKGGRAEEAGPDLTRRFERIMRSERPLILDQEARTDAELAAAHVARAEKLAGTGDADAALRELTQAAYLDPHSARAHILLSRAHRARGDADKALGEIRMSLWCRDDPSVRLELAALLREQRREAEARVEAEKVLRAEPGNAAARTFLDAPK